MFVYGIHYEHGITWVFPAVLLPCESQWIAFGRNLEKPPRGGKFR